LTARERAACLTRLEAPEARVALGGALLGTARAAIDISDGLLADLGHVAERSRVAAVVELERVPASRAVARRLDDPAVIAALLAGGDDYELCFTASPRARKRVAGIARRAGVALSRIGRIEVRRRGAPAVTVLDGEGRPLSVAAAGYDHFARAARRRTLLR
ncbi:MAG: thiamine-phosphate kinase, partial [Betaproteobacteria bacterium]|nr:thiamine-phosphate kinase [Betaproteobacteria bacterium]